VDDLRCCVDALTGALPFVLIGGRAAFQIYCAAFFIVGGWMLYDSLVPFRYVAPDFFRQIEDSGGSYTMSVTHEKRYYWITRFVPSSFESWLSVASLVWPFLLGSVYRYAYVRGHRNA
jgi:hypothetical protein